MGAAERAFEQRRREENAQAAQDRRAREARLRDEAAAAASDFANEAQKALRRLAKQGWPGGEQVYLGRWSGTKVGWPVGNRSTWLIDEDITYNVYLLSDGRLVSRSPRESKATETPPTASDVHGVKQLGRRGP